MKRKLRKSLSWLLTFAMVISLFCGMIPSASAVDNSVWNNEYGTFRIYLDDAVWSDFGELTGGNRKVRLYSDDFNHTYTWDTYGRYYEAEGGILTERFELTIEKFKVSDLDSLSLVRDEIDSHSSKINIPITGNDKYEVQLSEESLSLAGLVKVLRIDVYKKAPVPTQDELTALFNGKIKVDCSVAAAGSHTEKPYGLLIDEGALENVAVSGSHDTGYTYTVTLSPEKYAEAYSTDVGRTHKVVDGTEETIDVTLKYVDGEWTLPEEAIPETIQV